MKSKKLYIVHPLDYPLAETIRNFINLVCPNSEGFSVVVSDVDRFVRIIDRLEEIKDKNDFYFLVLEDTASDAIGFEMGRKLKELATDLCYKETEFGFCGVGEHPQGPIRTVFNFLEYHVPDALHQDPDLPRVIRTTDGVIKVLRENFNFVDMLFGILEHDRKKKKE